MVSHKPMMDGAVIAELQRIILSGPRPFDIFEWGSGGSSIWFASKRVGRVVTVDHNPMWHARVAEAAKQMDIPIHAILRRAIRRRGCRHSFGHQHSLPDMDFNNYARVISGRYDLILVDGRARAMCFRKALNHVRQSGFIVLHDAERECYSQCRVRAIQRGLFVRDICEKRFTLICQSPIFQ